MKTFRTHQEVNNYLQEVAKEYEIDVKNIKFFQGHDGMTGINADVYYKNKKFAHAYDDAYGGEMDIRPINYAPVNLSIYKDLEDALKLIPKYKVDYKHDINGKPIKGGGFTYDSSVDIESIVDALATIKQQAKEDKAAEKKGILYTDTNGADMIVTWKYQIPILIKKYPTKGIDIINKKIQVLYSEGATIRNAEYLRKSGATL